MGDEEVTNKDLKVLIETLITKGNTLETSNNEVVSSNSKILEEVKGYRSEYSQVISKSEELQTRVHALEKELNYYVNKEKAKNIMLFNIPDSKELAEDTIVEISKLFSENSIGIKKEEIEAANPLKAKNRKRPVLVTLSKASLKKLIFGNLKKFRDQKIGVANDLSFSGGNIQKRREGTNNRQ